MLTIILTVYVLCFTAFTTQAFITPSCRTGTSSLQNVNIRDTSFLQLASDDDNNNSDQENNAADAIGGNLVTALAKLDQKWLATQDDKSKKKIGEWTILDVKEEDDATSPPEIVYLLEPTSGVPSCVIFFLGGAVLGQFPHISYSTFLQKLSVKMNASVIAIPYEVGLDHFSIAQRCVKRMKNSIIECEDTRGYPNQLPKYAVGHSLGAKLHSIGIAATGIGDELAGLGCISYNNFAFAETITMASSFAKELDVGSPIGGFGPGNPAFDTLLDLAGMAVSAVGLEFTPSPSDMNKIIETKLANDEEILKKIRMFSFDDDDLDSTKGFVKCFEEKEGSGSPAVSYLSGTHLTVSYYRFGTFAQDVYSFMYLNCYPPSNPSCTYHLSPCSSSWD